MLRYNTQQKRLVLPEYGRYIQQMVDHCVTIEDRDERTRCAYSIVASMANLFPELKHGGEYSSKLWDHLAIMSDFRLDIDYPCEIIRPDSLHTLPDRVDYRKNIPYRRTYGKMVEQMIAKAAAMEPGEERDEFIRLLANQMKKLLTEVNREGVEDARVLKDLYEMSDGAIRITPDQMKLHEYIIPAQPAGKKKKKK